LDDLRAQAEEWCEQARLLCEAPKSAEPARLTRRLNAVAKGLRLRRQLDQQRPEEPLETSRRELVRRLTALELHTAGEMQVLPRGTSHQDEVAVRVKEWLSDVRSSVRSVVCDLRLGALRQGLATEGLRTDLEWLSALVARLDGEAAPSAAARLDVELGRLRGWLGKSAGGKLGPSDEPLLARCERMQAVALQRRIRHELDLPSAGASPEALWLQRWQLSRLQAQLQTLNDGFRAGPSPARLDGSLARRLDELADRRAALADQADNQLAVLPLAGRAPACEHIVQTALDEIGETIAFLEDMVLRGAVARLKLLRDDLDRLVVSCRRWAGPTESAPGLVGGAADPAAVRPDGDAHAENARASAGSSARAGFFPPHEVAASRPVPPGKDGREPAAVKRLRRQTRRARRAARRVRGAWQEKLLTLRMEWLFGRRFAAILDNTVLVLILVLVGLIAAEVLLERTAGAGLSIRQHEFFAWADLAVCSVFLFEFGLKMILAPNRMSYFLRHCLIDLVPSLPVGFLAHQIELDRLQSAVARGSETSPFRRAIQFSRMGLRLLRVALPVARLARVGLVLLRLSDRVVRRMAKVLNRNIILFEPLQTQKAESADRHRLVTLRSELEHARTAIEARLDRDQTRVLASRVLGDLECRVDCLPALALETAEGESPGREIPVEAVVEQLIQMTPERLLERVGPVAVRAVDRYLRLLDLPLVRRLPVVRNLVAYREKSPAEAVALASNYLGHLIQRGLDVVYFLADLHGTLSPPVFLDRLGATLISATRTPAKRLLWLGSIFLVLFLVVQASIFPTPVRLVVDKVQNLLGWPVIILGVICLVFWLLGAWFRKIANQSADFCERVVEAQFATHTKNLKSRRREQDAQFLAERVIDPELLLRSSDDRLPEQVRSIKDEDGESAQQGPGWFENRELAFLRNVRLLYQDYLDGSPLHRSDTKASVQLLGNLALGNLRRSHLGHLLRESRAIDRLDLSRSGGLFGGPYLWFSYITRMLVQETALLILDYNRHVVPLDRLACSPDSVREKFRSWLAGRLKIDPAEVWLPEPMTGSAGNRAAGDPTAGPAPHAGEQAPALDPAARPEAGAFLETVEFTAVDFLADDAERDAEIHGRFGPQVAELVRRDRQQNVRRAFRSFPLHELPLAARTLNPFSLYENYLAGGRLILLPIHLARGVGRALAIAVGSIYRVVHEILHPQVDRQQLVPPDTYWAALRKIHRMRKPVFMGSLWLRARFDVEYLGLPLPTAPAGIAGHSLMEQDLDYIGATRRDRIIAEAVRRQHSKRLEWVARWLDRFGWTFGLLPQYLVREIPYLGNRGGEALRALVAACILDHDDIATLALSIEGLKRAMAHAADSAQDARKLPPGLPDPVVNLKRLWHPVNRCRRKTAELFELPCFPAYNRAERKRVIRYLRRHRRVVRGWIKVVLGQGARDPWATVKSRMDGVLLRTDLWSDQILVLRAVQSLTMLDLKHNCELVWSLGGYTRPEPGGAEAEAHPPSSTLQPEDEPLVAAR
jgi:hypothetical protein